MLHVSVTNGYMCLLQMVTRVCYIWLHVSVTYGYTCLLQMVTRVCYKWLHVSVINGYMFVTDGYSSPLVDETLEQLQDSLK